MYYYILKIPMLIYIYNSIVKYFKLKYNSYTTTVDTVGNLFFFFTTTEWASDECVAQLRRPASIEWMEHVHSRWTIG